MNRQTRWAAVIQYRGDAYCGWQVQPNDPSVQQVVNTALGSLADHSVKTTCAGRTDTGVHALGQVIHFDTHAKRDANNWLRGFAAGTPGDVSMSWVGEVGEDFHARYSCTARNYLYLIHNAPVANSLHSNFMLHWKYPLDIRAMKRAARRFQGRMDFSAVRASGCQAPSPVREIKRIKIVRHRGNFVSVRVCADAFLLRMVRNMVAVLLEVGGGRKSPEWVSELLASKDRTLAPETIPAQGLILERADYRSKHRIAKPPGPLVFF